MKFLKYYFYFLIIFENPYAFAKITWGHKIKNQYIVELKSKKTLPKKLFSCCDIQEIVQINSKTYLLKLGKDPGLSNFKINLGHQNEIQSIQPNYNYKQR